MTDREKLVDVLFIIPPGEKTLGELADHLIAHGVTVREKQKPIAETDLGKYIDAPVWVEEIYRAPGGLPFLLSGIGIYYAEFEEFGRKEKLDRRIDDYNYQWRCWAEKPTDAERMAALWE